MKLIPFFLRGIILKCKQPVVITLSWGFTHFRSSCDVCQKFTPSWHEQVGPLCSIWPWHTSEHLGHEEAGERPGLWCALEPSLEPPRGGRTAVNTPGLLKPWELVLLSGSLLWLIPYLSSDLGWNLQLWSLKLSSLKSGQSNTWCFRGWCKGIFMKQSNVPSVKLSLYFNTGSI